MNLEKYRALFVEEATDHLGEMSQALTLLERPGTSASDAAEAIDTLFRMAHSIKGMAASLDYGSVSNLSHALEDWLTPVREAGSLSDDGVGRVYQIVGALEDMVGHVEGTGEVPDEREDLLEMLREPALAKRKSAGRKKAPSKKAETRTPAPGPTRRRRTVRVHAETVDRFLAAVGELMQRQVRLETLYRESPLWDKHQDFGEELVGMERVVRDLRRRALEIRTTPARRVLERVPRVASELARALGKRLVVELSGEEVEVDRAVLDHLDDPLLHLLRNAVDHGLESPAERKKSGKDPVGRIEVTASRVGGRLKLRVSDDGRGIDVESLRKRAVDCGMLPEAVAEDLPRARLEELIFEPGMSTRNEVSEVSGRGVGMDAVKRSITALGGSISVFNKPGQGLAFELDLPSMVALQRVLILDVAGERAALPVVGIEEVIDLSPETVERAGSEAFAMWRDEPIPLLNLAQAIGLGMAVEHPGHNAVLVDVGGFRYGIEVDRALNEQEIFVREVPAAIAERKYLGGVAVLPDGVPVFLLEVGVLAEPFA